MDGSDTPTLEPTCGHPGAQRHHDRGELPQAFRVVRRSFQASAVTVAGLVLAGGRGARVGGRDKGLLRDRGQPMAARAAALLAGVCDEVVISANRNLSRYAILGDAVVSDGRGDHLGPLAGIAAGLAVAKARFVLTCPCDATGVPANVPERLLRALRLDGRADVAVLRDEERRQPLLMALRGSLRESIECYLARGNRSAHGWLDTVKVVEVRIRSAIGNRNVTGTRSYS